MFNKKLAYFETLAIFLWKGSYGIVFLSSGIQQAFYKGPFQQAFQSIVPVEIVLAFLYGAILAVQISGKLVRQQVARKAPDLLGMIQ